MGLKGLLVQSNPQHVWDSADSTLTWLRETGWGDGDVINQCVLGEGAVRRGVSSVPKGRW